MKKIISALAIGAVAAGSAFAELKVNLNYRNGLEFFKYERPGLGENANPKYNQGSTTNWFKLNGWNGGSDNLALVASGDIFTFKATVKPTAAADTLNLQVLSLGAKWNGFFFDSGWNGDGIMNFRSKKDADDGNEEGKIFELFKLGSAFAGDGACANNQVSFSTARNFYAMAGYNADFGALAGVDGLSVKIQGTVMSDRWWEKTAASGDHSEEKDGNKGWAVFVNPKMNNLFEAELFVKGIKVGKTAEAERQLLVMGAYAKPLGIAALADGAFGGSLVVKGAHVQEWNLDLRAYLRLSEALTLTSFNKYSHVCSAEADYTLADGKETAAAMAGLGKFKSSNVLWNMLAARYVINPTVTGVLIAGQITDLDSQAKTCDGTQIYVYPHAQIFAAGNASISTGVLLGFGGIGADAERNKDVDILVNIPLLFRVKM